MTLPKRTEIARTIKSLRKTNYRTHHIGTFVGRWDKPDMPEYVLRDNGGNITQPDAFRGCYTRPDAEKIRLSLALRNEKTALKCLLQGHEPLCI